MYPTPTPGPAHGLRRERKTATPHLNSTTVPRRSLLIAHDYSGVWGNRDAYYQALYKPTWYIDPAYHVIPRDSRPAEIFRPRNTSYSCISYYKLRCPSPPSTHSTASSSIPDTVSAPSPVHLFLLTYTQYRSHVLHRGSPPRRPSHHLCLRLRVSRGVHLKRLHLRQRRPRRLLWLMSVGWQVVLGSFEVRVYTARWPEWLQFVGFRMFA